MKRLLLAALLATAALASAQTTALPPGGSLTITCTPGAPPAVPPVVVPPIIVPPAPPLPPVPPAVCGRPIPFASYLAQSCDLLCVQTIKGWGGLSDCEFEAAFAVGHPRPAGRAPSTGGLGFPPGFDLTGRVGAGVRNPLAGNVAYVFTFTAARTARAYWTVEINPGDRTATGGTIAGIDLTVFSGWWRVDFNAVAGQQASLPVQFNGTATTAVAVQYAE